MEQNIKMMVTVGVVLLILGGVGGYYYGRSIGMKAGLTQAAAEAQAKAEEATAAAEKLAAQAANPFAGTANPLENVDTNPFAKVKLNPFAQ